MLNSLMTNQIIWTIPLQKYWIFQQVKLELILNITNKPASTLQTLAAESNVTSKAPFATLVWLMYLAQKHGLKPKLKIVGSYLDPVLWFQKLMLVSYKKLFNKLGPEEFKRRLDIRSIDNEQ